MKVTMNEGKLSAILPDGFKELTSEEITARSGKSAKDNWAASNDEKHIMINITWKNIPLLGKIVDLKKTVSTTQGQIEKVIPTFKKIRDVETTIASLPAEGFVYEYQVQNIDMVSQYLLIKANKQYYAFMLIVRKENYNDYLPEFDNFLSSVVL